MTNYNDGKWHAYTGSNIPDGVHPKSEIKTYFIINGEIPNTQAEWMTCSAGGQHWANVIAFQVIKEHKEPRGGLVNFNSGEFRWSTTEDFDYDYLSDGYVYVREVLP